MSRSRTGCRTCRARKKKCDEQYPTCAVCTRLGIECRGYGLMPEPSRQADHTYRRHRAVILKDVHDSDLESRFHVWRLSKKQYIPSKTNQVITYQLSSEMAGYNIRGSLSVADESNFDSQLEVDFHESFKGGPHIPHHNMPRLGNWQIYGGIDPLNMNGKRNQRNSNLLANYFNNVFSLIAYFYQPPAPSFGDHWLLSLFPRSYPLYYSCLVLGLYYELILMGNGSECSIEPSFEARQLYSFALIGVQNRINELASEKDEESQMSGVDLLASVWQLLTMEVWATTEGNWELHWDGMGRILSRMALRRSNEHSSSIQTSIAVSQMPRMASNCIEDVLSRSISQWSPESAALKFYIECYAWMDILATATVGPKLHAGRNFNYAHLLRDDKIQLANLMGCHDWVMFTIKQISSFQDWKKRIPPEQRSGKSSEQFERRMVQLQHRLANGLSSLLYMRVSLNQGLEMDRSLVTEVFIYAAMVYLHVVAFGSQLDTPRLQEPTSKALEALKSIPKRLLIRLSWPFSIIACMANREQEEQCRDVIRGARQEGCWIGTVIKGLLLMEECWRLRRIQAHSIQGVDWMVAMKSLGIKVLLI